MSMIEKEEAIFSSDDAEIVAEYAAMSKLSVAALALGLFSLLALIHSLLLVVPVIAVVVSFVALYVVRASEDELSGRWLALAGMTFACLFGSWGASMFYTHETTLFNQARKYCDEWLQLVADGRLYEAFELHLDYEDREAPKTNLAGVYEGTEHDDHAHEDIGSEGHGLGTPSKVAVFHEWWAQSPRRELVEFGSTGTITFLHPRASDKYNDMGTVAVDELPLDYRLDYEVDGKKKSLTFVVIMNRFNFTGRYEWSVAEVIIPKKK